MTLQIPESQPAIVSQHPPSTAPGKATAHLATLIDINNEELFQAFGVDKHLLARFLLGWLSRGVVRRFALEIQTFDNLVGSHGLSPGGQWIVRRFAKSLHVSGTEYLPPKGPLLIVANHPGYTDAAALLATIPRADLRIVAEESAFFDALPNTSHHLLSVAKASAARLGVVRQAARHLRSGGAVLIFPGGQIEPDPAFLPGAAAALEDWSTSLELFARLTPPLTIVPALISGVLSPTALRHPLTRLRRTERNRHWLAATLQIIRPALRPTAMRLRYGTPLYVPDLLQHHTTSPISAIVLDAMRHLLLEEASRVPGNILS